MGPLYEQLNHGIFWPEPFSGKEYIGGWVSAIPQDDLLATGDWRPYLPIFEKQYAPSWDTMSCVSYSALNTLEILHRFRFEKEVNWSDRFLASMSGTTKHGNTFGRVWDTIRHYGVVDEGQWPPVWESWEAYMAYPSEEVRNEGLEWHDRYDVGYEFIWPLSDDTLRAALKKAPLQIAIGDDATGTPLHALTLTHLGEDGTRFTFDTYPQTGEGRGILPPTRRIYAAVRPHIVRRNDLPFMIYPPKNSLVIVADTGERMMYVEGDSIYKDDAGKIILEVIARNAADGKTQTFPVKHYLKEDLSHLKRIDLKGESV